MVSQLRLAPTIHCILTSNTNHSKYNHRSIGTVLSIPKCIQTLKIRIKSQVTEF